LMIFRLSGKRTLADVTTFDLVLTLIISESIQQALIGTDNSLVNGLLVVMTLVSLDILISVLKRRFPRLDKTLEGMPLTVYHDGRRLEQGLRRERVTEEDILAAARELQGLDRLEDIRKAVIERTGRITIVPAKRAQ
jgi:uncharacterized membrane protein YcaP (DUF421 family)